MGCQQLLRRVILPVGLISFVIFTLVIYGNITLSQQEISTPYRRRPIDAARELTTESAVQDVLTNDFKDADFPVESVPVAISDAANVESSIRKSDQIINQTPVYLPDNSTVFLKWGPMIKETCDPQMQSESAPCLKERRHKNTNLIEAQELIYRPFRMRIPRFATDMEKKLWLSYGANLDRMRISNDHEWADYPTFYAQNLVFANATYNGDPPADTWSDQGCMGGRVSHLSFLNTDDAGDEGSTTVDTLIIATSPDSWSFQHFLDRVAVVWSQAELAYRYVTL
jgi:hypothetical protein